MLTAEQQKALALARARLRISEKNIKNFSETAKANLASAETLEPEQPLAVSGKLGEITKGTREQTAQYLEGKSPVDRFVTEIAPSTIGTGLGALAGFPLGPFGVLLGGMIGGGIGEFGGQATGLAPPSNFNLGVATGAPIIGRTLVGTKRLIQRVIGKTVEKIPASKAALANAAEQAAVPELNQLGASVLLGQNGLRATPAKELFNTIEKIDAPVPVFKLENTFQAMQKLRGEVLGLEDFPEAKAVLQIINNVTSASLGLTLDTNPQLTVGTVVKIRRQLGGLVGKLENSSGLKFGSAKLLFGAIAEDLDKMAQGADAIGRVARVAQAANKQFTIESASQEFQQAIIRFSKPVPTQDAVQISVKDMRKWLNGVTNPVSANYDQNFTEGIKSALPRIKESLRDLEKITNVSRSAGGPGSLVVRTISAGSGGYLGGLLLGTPGMAIGSLFGATAPDALLVALSTPKGAARLKKIIELGRGGLSMDELVRISQPIVQSLTRDFKSDQSIGNQNGRK